MQALETGASEHKYWGWEHLNGSMGKRVGCFETTFFRIHKSIGMGAIIFVEVFGLHDFFNFFLKMGVIILL